MKREDKKQNLLKPEDNTDNDNPENNDFIINVKKSDEETKLPKEKIGFRDRKVNTNIE